MRRSLAFDEKSIAQRGRCKALHVERILHDANRRAHPISMASVAEVAEKLKTTVWRTRGARFNAARRLRLKDRWSTFSLAGLGIWGILLAVIQKIYNFSPGSPVDNAYTTLTIFLSIAVLVLSLLEGANDYSLKAERLDKNAMRLGEIQADLELTLAAATPQELPNAIGKLRDEYDAAVGQCPENHEPIDDLLFVTSHRNGPEFQLLGHGAGAYASALIRYWVNALWLFVLFLAIPLAWFIWWWRGGS
jgi:hypothetical protein